jgi:hypothetical protein
MTGVDEISRMLGELRADNAEAMRQREAMWNKFDEVSKTCTEISGCVKMLGAQHIALATRIDAEHAPVINEMKQLKQRGIGVLAILGIVGTVIAAMLSSAFDKFFGK